MENGQGYITNEYVLGGNSSILLCREPRNSQSSRLQAVLTDHVKIGPVTGIEGFKYAGTRLMKYKYRNKYEEFRSLGREYDEEFEQYARHFILTETDHQNLDAVSPQQSVRCGRPRAQETGGNSPVRYKVAPKPKFISIEFSLRI